MAKYLDQTGLKYFWGKIKAKMPGPLQAYPVGSVYISISSNFNPNTSFGGKWERFGQGRTLVGEGTGNDGTTSMNFTAGSSGGEYKHKHTTKTEFPKYQPYKSGFGLKYCQGESVMENPLSSDYSSTVQPYITVYFWKRTA